nr:hypothetical protein [Tanacetum cinerariifolium]
EMIVLLMEKFLLLLKNNPLHLLHHLLHHHNHLKITLQHPMYNKHHHNHLRKEEDKEVADKDVEEAKVDEIPAAITATLTVALVRVAAAPSRRRKGVIIRNPEEESTTSTIIPAETKSKDKGKGILLEEPKPLKKKQQIEQDEQYAKELHAELNKDIGWD